MFSGEERHVAVETDVRHAAPLLAGDDQDRVVRTALIRDRDRALEGLIEPGRALLPRRIIARRLRCPSESPRRPVRHRHVAEEQIAPPRRRQDSVVGPRPARPRLDQEGAKRLRKLDPVRRLERLHLGLAQRCREREAVRVRPERLDPPLAHRCELREDPRDPCIRHGSSVAGHALFGTRTFGTTSVIVFHSRPR